MEIQDTDGIPGAADHDVGVAAAPAPTTGSAPIQRRALIYLALCLAFAAILLVPMVLGGGAAGGTSPCGLGASIAQAALIPNPAGGTPHLFAVVRPPALPNTAPGEDPGCDALYRSDDNGITWTVAFSATAEAPIGVAPSGGNTIYLLTQRLGFPLYFADNLYRSDTLGAAWTWYRVSPQGRHDVPYVSATDMLVGQGRSVILREGNGDGAALVRSTDGGVTWQPIVIPNLLSAWSVALLGPLIAVAPPHLTPGKPPGMVSVDGGDHWRSLGKLPGVPARADARAVLSAGAVERALILDLAPITSALSAPSIARYASLDGGRTWTLARCGARPAPGCAPPSRWAQTAGARYVLYHHRIFRALPGRDWRPLSISLPVASEAVLQLLAAPSLTGDALYLTTAGGIWRLQDGRWQSASPGLALGGPTPIES